MGGKKPQLEGYHPRKEAHQVKLDDMLSFGDENLVVTGAELSAKDTTDRLNQLLRKLKELNQRVDALQNRY